MSTSLLLFLIRGWISQVLIFFPIFNDGSILLISPFNLDKAKTAFKVGSPRGRPARSLNRTYGSANSFLPLFRWFRGCIF